MDEIGQDRLEQPRGFNETETPEADDTEPTEEEQMDYDLLTVRARSMIFGKGRDNILKLMGSSERPSKGLGQAAAALIKTLMGAAKQKGREIDPETALAAGAEIVADLNELAKKNGVYQYDTPEEEDTELEDAMLWGVKFYGDGMLKSGEITPDMQQQAKQSIAQGIEEEKAAGAQVPNKVMQGIRGAMNTNPASAGSMAGMGGGQAQPAQPQAQPPGGVVAGKMGG